MTLCCMFLALPIHHPPKDSRHHNRQRNDPPHEQKIQQHARAPTLERHRVVGRRHSPPPPQLLLLLRPKVPVPIEMRHIVRPPEGPSPCTPVPTPAGPSRILGRRRPRPRKPRLGRRVRLGLPLGTVRAPPAGAVEARRGSTEMGAAFAESAGRTGTGGAGGRCSGGVVGAATVEGAGGGGGGGVAGSGGRGEGVAVVAVALGGAAEDGVGFGDLDEAGGGGGRVGGVVVWVMGFGEVEVLSVFWWRC